MDLYYFTSIYSTHDENILVFNIFIIKPDAFLLFLLHCFYRMSGFEKNVNFAGSCGRSIGVSECYQGRSRTIVGILRLTFEGGIEGTRV